MNSEEAFNQAKQGKISPEEYMKMLEEDSKKIPKRDEYHSMKSQGINIQQSIDVRVPEGMPVIDVINNIIEGSTVDKNLISDGYHTFGELYEHRIQLFITLCKQIEGRNNVYQGEGFYENIIPVWMTNTHSDGTVWEGWFILGIETEKGKQITYHLPESKWEECKKLFKVIYRAPEWDGHTSADVLERLKLL